ncbi:MAG: hypothetical protein AAFZ15_02260 [Bacteroidota bacterium]
MSDVILCRDNLVMGVNRPGHPDFDTYTVQNGDQIGSTTYTPTKTQNPSVPAGNSYNCFMLTQSDGTQAFLQWSPDDPRWQDLLKPMATVVRGIGSPGPNTLKEGDRYTLRAGGNPLGLTWDVYRDGQPCTTFSCLVPGNPPRPE